jgi:hypothetical protein
MWSPHQRGGALNQSADGPVLRTTQRVRDQRQSQTMFIGRLLCGARISEHPSTDSLGCSMHIPTSLAPFYRLFALLGGTAVFGCSLVFWKTVLH